MSLALVHGGDFAVESGGQTLSGAWRGADIDGRQTGTRTLMSNKARSA
jgi:hypothetical protein